MVPKITKTLNQVTPHQHPLVREEVTNANSTDHDGFICSGCDTHGTATGVRYRCKQQYCNFNLHEDCATCSKILSTHIHPKHQLKLVWRFKDDLPCCDVCGDQVKGLYYSCPDASCNTFVLHPICSKFPSHVPHIIDRKHSLTFQLAVPSWCTICRDPCTSWRYRCGPCKIDIHLECVVSTPCHDPPNSGASTPKQQQQQQYQPPAPNYPPNKENNYHQQHQHNYQQPPPPPMQQQQYHHHHQQKRALPNHDFGYPVQKPPLPSYNYVYNQSSTFGIMSPPPVVHYQYYYGQQQQQYYYGQQQQQYYQQPPPFVAHPYNMYYQQQPAYHQGGGGGGCGGGGGVATSSSSSSSSSTSSSGGRKRKMCLVVARIAASLAVSAVLGIPVISPFC